jgi:hypothetical protein
MEYRTLASEENETPEGPDQTISPYLRFESQEDTNNGEKRKENRIETIFF